MTVRRQSGRMQAAGRRGSTLVVALVCLAVAAAITATMFRGTTAGRRMLRAEHDLRQVELLLDAGTVRAAARIAAGTIEGETLTLESSEIAGAGSARVDLAVARQDGGWELTVVVEYPLDGPVSMRRTRDTFIPSLAPLAPQEKSP